MIAGLNLHELADRIVSDARAKTDLMVDSRALSMRATEDSRVLLDLGGRGADVNPHAFSQIMEEYGVPIKYARRMLEAHPAMLADDVSTWIADRPGEKRLVRCFNRDGKLTVRAFVSDKYRPLDYEDLAEATFPILEEAGMVIKSSQITETRLYIQAVSMSLMERIKVGTDDDFVHPGVVISNSEVGAGRLSIEGLLYKVRCTNGLIHGATLRKNHIGGKQAGFFGDNDVQEYFTDETRKLSDAALWAQVRDVLRAACDETKFRALVRKFENAGNTALPNDYEAVVDVTAKRWDLSEGEKKSVLYHYLSNGKGPDERTQYDLVNAVTRAAQDVESYDRAVELERLGGVILDADLRNLRLN